MKYFGYAILFSSLAAAHTFAAHASSIPAFAAIPTNAHSSGDLSTSGHWEWSHDSGTPGSSVGSSQYPVGNPSLDGKAREYYVSYSDKAGERFSLSFAHDSEATHFVYDTYVYIDDPAQVGNLENDMNQVMANGKTVIYGFQCSAYSGTWEYSLISGGPHWHSTGLACSPKKWTPYKWHHVQIASHRNSSGDVTYDWVNLDGDYKQVNKGGNGAENLHWAVGDLILNFQLDGAESRGSVKMYTDKLTIFYW